jgi:hypothetical protein
MDGFPTGGPPVTDAEERDVFLDPGELGKERMVSYGGGEDEIGNSEKAG